MVVVRDGAGGGLGEGEGGRVENGEEKNACVFEEVLDGEHGSGDTEGEGTEERDETETVSVQGLWCKRWASMSSQAVSAVSSEQ